MELVKFSTLIFFKPYKDVIIMYQQLFIDKFYVS